jgi:hypothetical protein
VDSFLQASPPQLCTYFSPFPIRATSPAHRIPLDFITLTIYGQQYQSFSSSLCSFSQYQIQTPSAASYSRTPSACALKLMQWFSKCGWRSAAESRETCRRLHIFTKLGYRQVDPLEHLNTAQLAKRCSVCFPPFNRGTRGPQTDNVTAVVADM